MRILLVEDDRLLGESLHRALTLAHYACDWISDGNQVAALLSATHFDLLVLDIGLPGRSGLEVLREMRKKNIRLPVLLLTARDSVEDKVKGLDSGADDYLTKPFELEELYARIRALLRRQQEVDQNMLRCGSLRFDCKAREVFHDDRQIDLTATEIAILESLMRNGGHYVSTRRLEDSIYTWDREVESNTVQVYVSRLRKRFGNDFIENKRGVGYRIPK
jgi:two-component system response regulator QseB